MRTVREGSKAILRLSLICSFALAAGISLGERSQVQATGECTTSETENCEFYACSGSNGWTSSDFAVEYDVLAFPWFNHATSISRLRRLTWKDTTSSTASWPPMTVTAYYGASAPYHSETLTVNENGSTSGTSAIRVWTLNGSTSLLCDGYTGRSTRMMEGSCIGSVFYGIDVIDSYSSYGCLNQVTLHPTSTSVLKAQDPLTCPDGTNRTPVNSPTITLSCTNNYTPVSWNYE